NFLVTGYFILFYSPLKTLFHKAYILLSSSLYFFLRHKKRQNISHFVFPVLFKFQAILDIHNSHPSFQIMLEKDLRR
ncbi:MAG TPA: hypothetical protein DCQ45_04950, partial [Erysipelotrichaceae bacterium]|nr:hypothetical protein [Erysipelotrichaceae bacterium]